MFNKSSVKYVNCTSETSKTTQDSKASSPSLLPSSCPLGQDSISLHRVLGSQDPVLVPSSSYSTAVGVGDVTIAIGLRKVRLNMS